MSFDSIENNEALNQLERLSWKVMKARIQAADETIAAWLVGPYVKTFDTKTFSEVLQGHPRFKNWPVAVKITLLKFRWNDKTLQWDDPNACKVAVVSTLAEPGIRAKVLRVCISVFNRRKNAAQRPLGYSFTALQWFGSRGIRAPTVAQLRSQEKAKLIHQDIQARSKEVDIVGLTSLDYAQPYNGYELRPRGVLITMRTKVDWDTPIFTQIDETWDGNIIAICHANEEEEARSLVDNLYTLMRAKLGPVVNRWFDAETKELAQEQRFDEINNRIVSTGIKFDEELLEALTRYKDSPAQRAKFLKEGGNKKDLKVIKVTTEGKIFNQVSDSASITSDEESMENNTFDIENIFSLEVPEKAGPQHDDASFGTHETGGETLNSQVTGASSGSKSTTNSTTAIL